MEMVINTSHQKPINKDENNLQGCTSIFFESQDVPSTDKVCKEEFEQHKNWRLRLLLMSNDKSSLVQICLYNAVIVIYLLAAINHWYKSDSEDIGWKNGLGLLIIISSLYYGFIIIRLLLRPLRFLFDIKSEALTPTLIKGGALCVFFASFAVYLFLDTQNNRRRLLPLLGLAVFVALGWQMGRYVVQTVGELSEKFFSFAYIGAEVTYGHELVDNYGVFAFKVLSVLFFMCFVIEILFYYGIIQKIVINLGWCLQKLLGTTAAESVNTCASVFLGM
ncbi:Hypothetical protein CINCED_3A015401, partial [Cinara cedri]